MNRIGLIVLACILLALAWLAAFYLDHDKSTPSVFLDDEVVHWPDGSVRFRWSYESGRKTPAQLYEKAPGVEGTMSPPEIAGIFIGFFAGVSLWLWLCISMVDEEWWTPARERARQKQRKC